MSLLELHEGGRARFAVVVELDCIKPIPAPGVYKKTSAIMVEMRVQAFDEEAETGYRSVPARVPPTGGRVFTPVSIFVVEGLIGLACCLT